MHFCFHLVPRAEVVQPRAPTLRASCKRKASPRGAAVHDGEDLLLGFRDWVRGEPQEHRRDSKDHEHVSVMHVPFVFLFSFVFLFAM